MAIGVNISKDKNTIFLQEAGTKEVRKFVAMDDIVVGRDYHRCCALCDLQFICGSKIEIDGLDIPCTRDDRRGLELESVFFKEVTE